MRIPFLRHLAFAALALAFCACKAEGDFRVTPTSVEGHFKGEVGHTSHEGTPPGKSLGKGKITLEDGSTFSGEFFDSDSDGKPDSFKPDAGQSGSGGGMSGTTTGNEYFDLTNS